MVDGDGRQRALMRRGDDGVHNSAAPLKRPSNNKIRVIWLKATAKEAIWYQGVAATLITRPAPTPHRLRG